jgi:2-polyprenyl-6-methoxyphenol hydroxylase-like FAD-dependent oxidoreductase
MTSTTFPQGRPAYARGRVVFAGDAAHAALPTAGQGAATALEDGVCVGRMIAAPTRAGGDLAAVLTAFDHARRPRCRQMARTAAMIARYGADLGGGGVSRSATRCCGRPSPQGGRMDRALDTPRSDSPNPDGGLT